LCWRPTGKIKSFISGSIIVIRKEWKEGIPPSNEKDDDYKNDPVFKFGTRISEKRLNSAKSMRGSSARIHFDFNENFKSHRNQSNSSESDDDVFITEKTVTQQFV
jgi:hypothetical protein